VADLTEIAAWEGTLYLAVVIDCYSRRCVGWAMADHMRAELVVEALEMAVWQRKPEPGLIHHSDQGSQPALNRSSQQCVRGERICRRTTWLSAGPPRRLEGLPGGRGLPARCRRGALSP
jgi:transposase InsO family protein